MSIIAGTVSAGQWGLLLASLAVAGVVFWLARAHEAGRVRGSARVDPAEAIGVLGGVTIAGFLGWRFACFAAVSLLAGPAAQGATQPAALPPLAQIWAGIIGQVGGVAVLAGAGLIFRPGGLGRLGLSPASWRLGLRAGMIGVCFVIPAMYCVAWGTDALWIALRFDHPKKHELLTAMDKSGALYLRLLAILSAVLFAPVFEELLFRGHIQTLLRRTFTEKSEPDGRVYAHDTPGRVWLGILFASAAFTMVHPFWTWPPIFFLALCLGYIYERTGTLWAPIVVHAVFNGIQTALSLVMS
jgi:membrane protease YdiL (CAAX protease family)